MSIVGKRIAALREEASCVRGIPVTQEDLGKLVNVKCAQVSHWERGVRGINDQKLVKVADVFSDLLGRPVSVDYILGREERAFAPPKDEETAPRTYPVGLTEKVPVFASFPLATAETPELIGEEEVAVKDLQECSGPVFFLVVGDNSMVAAGVHKGHRVLIDTKAPVADGDIVFVAVAGEEYASLRQIYREGDGVLVLPKGPNGKAMHNQSDVHVLGKMLWGRYYPHQQQG